MLGHYVSSRRSIRVTLHETSNRGRPSSAATALIAALHWQSQWLALTWGLFADDAGGHGDD